jgi:hypothetical protein
MRLAEHFRQSVSQCGIVFHDGNFNGHTVTVAILPGRKFAGVTNQDRGNALDNTATGVSIGREQYSGSLPAGRWFFNGQMDDVRIYKRALSQAEIQSIATSTAPAPPRIAAFGLSGSNFIFSGTLGLRGASCYVLTSTNAALPIANWARVATNEFGSDGSFLFTNVIDAPQMFYRCNSREAERCSCAAGETACCSSLTIRFPGFKNFTCSICPRTFVQLGRPRLQCDYTSNSSRTC